MSYWWWIILGVILILGLLLLSWRGVRKLRQNHSRSAVAQDASPAPEGSQKVAVILNPVKNQATEAKQKVTKLVHDACWPDPLFLETTEAEPGEAQARQALEWGADVVLVGGGDGTVRVVADVLKHTETGMGLIPLGTGNLLARNLSMDVNDLDGNLRTALFGRQRRIDTGEIEIRDAHTGDRDIETFLVIAGIGLDAEVVSDTNDQLKKSVGWLAYSEAGVRHLPGRRKKVSISLDQEPEQSRKVRSVLFCNCGLLPGGIDFIPGAMIDDGVLDIVVISPRSALGWIAMTAKVLFRHKGKIPVIDYYRAREVKVQTAVPQETQLDGDPSGQGSVVTVGVAPLSLLIRVA